MKSKWDDSQAKIPEGRSVFISVALLSQNPLLPLSPLY